MSEDTLIQPQPRKHFSAVQKMEVVQASWSENTSVAEAARRYNVAVSTLIKWRKQANEGSLMSMKSDSELVPASELKKLKKQMRQMERLLGKKTAQVEILKEAIELAREKKLISRHPLPGVDISVDD